MAAPDGGPSSIGIPVLSTTRGIGEKIGKMIEASITRGRSYTLSAASLPQYAHDNIATFSSFGPTLDGRIKPDLVAPGDRIQSAGITSGNGNDCPLRTTSGTSMATPHVAGAAALVRQYFMDGYYPSGSADASDAFTPTGPLIKAVMMNGAHDMTGFTDIGTPIERAPSFRQGFGLVRLDSSIYLGSDDGPKLFIVDGESVSTGDVYRYCVNVDSADADDLLRATVAWHDYPASLSTSKTLVNDIDLNVYHYDDDGRLLTLVESTDDTNNGTLWFGCSLSSSPRSIRGDGPPR